MQFIIKNKVIKVILKKISFKIYFKFLEKFSNFNLKIIISP